MQFQAFPLVYSIWSQNMTKGFIYIYLTLCIELIENILVFLMKNKIYI